MEYNKERSVILGEIRKKETEYVFCTRWNTNLWIL